jgi:hypothetical protein
MSSRDKESVDHKGQEFYESNLCNLDPAIVCSMTACFETRILYQNVETTWKILVTDTE